jgi:hypothetical protein
VEGRTARLLVFVLLVILGKLDVSGHGQNLSKAHWMVSGQHLPSRRFDLRAVINFFPGLMGHLTLGHSRQDRWVLASF